MPEFWSILPVLKVGDMDRSLAFYADRFGFEVVWRVPGDAGDEIARVRLGGVALLFSTGSHLGASPSFTGTFYIEMKDVDSFYERVKGRVDLVWPLETMEYGWKEFGVRDPDGYVIAFSEMPETP
jgi:uncharacterized glyoxalase superfamily protein PhnB